MEIQVEDKSCVLLVVVVKELHLERKEVAVVGWEERLSSNGSEHHLGAEEVVEVVSPVELLEEGYGVNSYKRGLNILLYYEIMMHIIDNDVYY